LASHLDHAGAVFVVFAAGECGQARQARLVASSLVLVKPEFGDVTRVLFELAAPDLFDDVDEPLIAARSNAARSPWPARAGRGSPCQDEADLPLAEPQIPRRNLTAPHRSVTAA